LQQFWPRQRGHLPITPFFRGGHWS